jgi:hypothetical protein
MIHLKEYNKWINEKINFSKFPNPLPDDTKGFLKAGLPQHDKSPFDDDIVETEDVSIPVKDLIPSQSSVYLGKALELAIKGIEGGDLGAVISNDGYIMDGHHRWACTMLNNPEKEVGGVMVNLPFNELLVVLRAVGDSMKNPRGTKPSGGDVIFFMQQWRMLKIVFLKENIWTLHYMTETKQLHGMSLKVKIISKIDY